MEYAIRTIGMGFPLRREGIPCPEVYSAIKTLQSQ